MSTTTNHIYISSRWYRNKVSAIETMAIDVPVTVASMVKSGQMENIHTLRNARVDGGDRIELRGCSTSQDDAQQRVLRAAFALRFLAATGLRTVTLAERDDMHGRLQGLPGQRVNSGAWINIESGTWVIANSTLDAVSDARATWARANGLAHIAPGWANVWTPGATIPHLFCSDVATAEVLVEILYKIHADGVLVWTGTSTPYVKPIKAEPVKRSRAPILTAEQHQEIGPILAALCASRLPQSAAKDVRAVRRALRGRLEHECSGADPVLIYGGDCTTEAIGDRAEQIAAIDRAVSVMATICSQRDALLVSLRRAKAWLVVSQAPRGSRPPRRAA